MYESTSVHINYQYIAGLAYRVISKQFSYNIERLATKLGNIMGNISPREIQAAAATAPAHPREKTKRPP